MKTENQKQQLKGYTQAVQEMSAEMQKLLDDSTIALAYFEKLESRMRHKVLRLVEQFDDE